MAYLVPDAPGISSCVSSTDRSAAGFFAKAFTRRHPSENLTSPFYIHEDLGKGRYKLKTESGEILKQTIHCARLKLYCDPIEVEADDDHSKQDVLGDQNVCNEVKFGCAKADASKQEVIEGQEKMKSRV